MELEDAIARSASAQAEMKSYRESGRLDDADFAALNAENLAALNAVVYARELDDGAFLYKLKYLTAFYASTQSVAPEVWQINGGLLLAIWLHFNWSAQNWPRWE